MPLPENHCSTLFTNGYKRLTEGGFEAFALGVFALSFCLRLLAFWCERLLEGKRIAEGELLKGNC
jgi:hypothetical protein